MWKGLREGHGELEVAPGWTVIEPPGRFPGPIERIAIGLGGILAVARWSGDVDVVDGVLHQGGRRRELQAADLVRATDQVASLLRKEHRAVLAPVVAVRGNRAPVKVSPGLVLIGVDRLPWAMAGLATHLGPDDIADALGRIGQARARRLDNLPTQATLAAALTADRARRR